MLRRRFFSLLSLFGGASFVSGDSSNITTSILHNHKKCYYYAIYILEGRFELGENIISKNAQYSYRY